MAQNIVDVEIPETLVPYLYTMKDGKTMDDKVTISIVVGLLVSGIIVDFLKTHNIPWGSYTEEELQMDEHVIDSLLEE